MKIALLYNKLTEKDKLQEHVINLYVKEHFDRGTIILPTGVGKTRVALSIVNELMKINYAKSCLIVTPTRVLKNDSWPKEIELLGMQKLNITIECKQTAYQFTEHYDIIIIDEVHTALSDVHGKVLDIPCKMMIGLTATLPSHNEEYTEELIKRLPIRYSISLMECVEREIVPAFKVFNMKVKLNKGERARYVVYNKMFETARIELAKQIKSNKAYWDEDIYSLAKDASSNPLHPLYRIAKAYWSGMSMRKWVCYRAEVKLKTCLELIQKYPNKKWIIFSKEIKFVDTLTQLLNDNEIKALAYHSNMKEADRILHLELITKSEYTVLVSAEALNVGYNLPVLDAGICASGVSTELVGTQMIGRINRYQEDKTPVMINLACENTQEEIWVKNRTKNIESTWINNTKYDITI